AADRDGRRLRGASRSLGAKRTHASLRVLRFGAAAEDVQVAVADSSAFPVPGYLPSSVRKVVPWARRHVARVAARYNLPPDDLWDEAITALIRASVYPDDPGKIAGTKDRYCQTAIHRACWHYVIRGHERRRVRGLGQMLSLTAIHEGGGPTQGYVGRSSTVQDPELALEVAYASAEEEVMAREAAYLRAQHSTAQESTALRARKTARSTG